MRSVNFLLAAGAASMLSTVAFAADMPSIMPPPPMMYAPVPVAQLDFGGWYLRGDIGITTTTGKLHTDLYDTLPPGAQLQQLGQGFAGGTSFGLGAGYQFNSWFRIDVTGEYRSRVGFTGTDFVLYGPGNGLGDAYTGGYTSWVGLINAYADLGTWYCITPFVGVGVGAANIKTTGLADVATFPAGTGNSSSYFAQGATRTNAAYALHAGLDYKVNNSFTVELAYRYLDMGTAVHGAGSFFDGTRAGQSTFQYRDMVSQDVRLGVRFNLDSPPAYAPPPPPQPVLMRRG